MKGNKIKYLPIGNIPKWPFIAMFLISPLCSSIFGQTSKIDSLNSLIKNGKKDTLLAKNLRLLSYEYDENGKSDSAFKLAERSLKLALQLKENTSIIRAYRLFGVLHGGQNNYKLAEEFYKKALALCNDLEHKDTQVEIINEIGLLFFGQGNYLLAKEYFVQTLSQYEDLKDREGIASALGNIGVIYKKQGDYGKALEYYLKSLKIKEEISNKDGIATCLGNIGNIYSQMKNYPKAKDYYLRTLKIYQEIKDKKGIASQFNNLGNICVNEESYEKALEYFFKALEIRKEIGYERGIAATLGNIGIVYKNQKDYAKAEKYYLESLYIKQKIQDKSNLSLAYNNLGDLFEQQNKRAEAESYFLKAAAFAKESGSFWDLIKPTENLAKLYYRTGNYKKAYEYLKEYHSLEDSSFSIEKEKDLTRKEMNYEFEKKEALTKADHDKQIAIAEADKRRQRLFSWLIAAIAVSVTLIALIIFRSLRFTRKQKQIIEEQKHLVEEHQKEIIDSINYAKRIQDAILPPLESIKQKLPNSFVLYKPKDIVAGDFYWMEEFDGIIFIAAADCTGHGVPGAMLSMVCSNALTRAVKEFGLRDTGKILDKVNELVLETFEKSSDDVKDGMDISLLSIDNQNKNIAWSGANNPIWFIAEGSLKEIKADKQPIGKTEYPKPFTTHHIEFKEGSEFFLFTDGLADQFGGPLAKKFKYKQFSELMLKINSRNVEEQMRLLDKAFLDWKGSQEQVDDVCIIGLHV